jgi:hypothetical protein
MVLFNGRPIPPEQEAQIRMKRTFIGLVLSGFIVFNLSPASGRAVAAPEQPDSQNQESGTFHAKIVLAGASAAPVDASGVAELYGKFGPGAGPSTLQLTAQRLPPGVYSLAAVRRSDGSSVFLGWIGVAYPGLGPEQEAGENTYERNSTHQVVVLATETQAELPPGLDPRDIALIVIADFAGNALLVGEVGA